MHTYFSAVNIACDFNNFETKTCRIWRAFHIIAF